MGAFATNGGIPIHSELTAGHFANCSCEANTANDASKNNEGFPINEGKSCGCKPCVLACLKTFAAACETESIDLMGTNQSTWDWPFKEWAPARFYKPPVPPPKAHPESPHRVFIGF
jgi:hypothetical protein